MATRRTFTFTALAAGAAAFASVAGAALSFALSPLVRRVSGAGAALDVGAAKDFDAVASGAAGAVEVVVLRKVEDGQGLSPIVSAPEVDSLRQFFHELNISRKTKTRKGLYENR